MNDGAFAGPQPVLRKRDSRTRVATEQRILSAATEVFNERGFSGATVAEMVEKSGVARGTFYLYFTDKRAVLNALVAVATKDLYDIVAPPNEASYRKRIHAATSAYFKALTRHRGVISCIFETATRDTEINRLQNWYREHFRRRIEAHFERKVRSGEFRPIDPKIASYCLSALVEGAA
jgi:AcrR family transcriptional regulator